MSRKRRFLTGPAKRQKSESGDGKKATRSNRRNTERSSPRGTRPIGVNGSHNQHRAGCSSSWRVLVCVFPYLIDRGCHALAQSAERIKRQGFLYRHVRADRDSCANHGLAGAASRLIGVRKRCWNEKSRQLRPIARRLQRQIPRLARLRRL
jgi:hypothetical protein